MNPRDKGIYTEFEQQKRAAHFQANKEEAIKLKFFPKGNQDNTDSALLWAKMSCRV